MDCCPRLLTAIVSRQSLAARYRGTTASAAGSGQRRDTTASAASSGQQAALRHHRPEALVPRGGGTSAAGLQWETIAGINPFLLHVAVYVLKGVKAKVPFPNHG